MDWLTTFVELLNGLGISEAVTLALSTLPLLGMAYEGEDDQPATEDPAADEGDLGDLDTDSDPPTPEEPFLRASENTVYKTSEAAIAGINEKDRVIGSYKQFGSPEEVAAKIARSEQFEQFQKAVNGNGKTTKPGAFDDLDPQRKQQFTDFDGVYSKHLKEEFATREDLEKAGYVRSDDIPELVARAQRITEARSYATEALQARGLEGTTSQAEIVNDTVERLESTNPELYRKIQGQFASGDVKGAVDLALDVVYGPLKVQDAAKNGATNNGRGRDSQGRFTAAELDARKRRTENLPKAPPQSGSRTSQTEERPALLDEKGRKDYANEVLDRMAQGG